MNRFILGWLVLVCRLIVGGVFIYASLDKLQHPDAFALVIHHYRLVPYSLLHPFAMMLPMVELIVGAALVLGLRQRGAALIAVLMNVMFMVAISLALYRGLDISCGCFNTDGGHGVGLTLLWRDALLLLACLPPLFSLTSGLGLDNMLKRKNH